MHSKFFENTVSELIELCGGYSELKFRRTMTNSNMLSSDVSAAYDPMFAEYYEKKNSAYLGNGLVFNKYSGSGGKSGANDANAEYGKTPDKLWINIRLSYRQQNWVPSIKGEAVP